MPLTDEQKRVQEKVLPILAEFSRKIREAGVQATALIFDPETDFVMRGGTVPHRGMELVRLHQYLTMACAILERQGDFEQTSVDSAPQVSNADEIADKLALSILAIPTDMVPTPILEMAQEYARARKK